MGKNKDIWLSEFLTDKYERLRRNPDYIKAINKLETSFDDDVFDASGGERDHAHISDPKFQDVRDRFGLNQLFSPEAPPPPNIAHLPIFKNQLAVSLSFNISNLDSDSDQGLIEVDPVSNCQFLDLRVDLDPKWTMKEILETVKEYVGCYRGIEYPQSQKKRIHFAKNITCYKVWDLAKVKNTFKEIAWELGLTPDAAKKAFYRAFELIVGKPYGKEAWREILQRQLGYYLKEKGDSSDLNLVNLYLKEEEIPRIGAILGKGNIEHQKDAHDNSHNQTEWETSFESICRGCSKSQCKEEISKIFDEYGEKKEYQAKNCDKFMKSVMKNIYK